MIRTVRRKNNGERGSAFIEFALVSVVFLSLLLGIIDVGRALFAYDFVSSAARRATRYAMVRGTSCSSDLAGCDGTNPKGAKLDPEVKAYIKSFAYGINTDDSVLGITGQCVVGGNPAGQLPCAPGQQVWIQVSYDFSFITPLIPRRTWSMTSKSQRTVSQ